MRPMPRIVLLLLVACSHPSRPTSLTNTVPPKAATTPDQTVVADDAEDDAEPECARYHELFARLDACTQLSEEDRQALVQQDTDMLASRSESGLDGSSPYDSEAGCADGTEVLMRVAAKPCGW